MAASWTVVSKLISEKEIRDVLAVKNKGWRENVTAVSSHSVSDTHIPSLVIYKRIQSTDAFGDSIWAGGAFEMTQSCCINVDVFLKWEDHFQKKSIPRKYFLIPEDNPCARHLHNNYIVLMFLPIYCTQRLGLSQRAWSQ
jgi:hypothetical protein